LRVSAERVFPVPPLTVPLDPSVASVEVVLQSEAGRLFDEWAAAAGSGFVLTNQNAVDVAAICRRLDGLPLAVELAAARMKVFAIDELREEIEKRNEVLTGGARDLPERQQTLRNTIEWSHDLLTGEERTVFALFSVFSDARLPDVEQTIGRAPTLAGVDVVEALSSLVDKSLVRVVQGEDGRPRFSMLQTIREYAGERLESRPRSGGVDAQGPCRALHGGGARAPPATHLRRPCRRAHRPRRRPGQPARRLGPLGPARGGRPPR
jgi:predicted ATPase